MLYQSCPAAVRSHLGRGILGIELVRHLGRRWDVRRYDQCLLDNVADYEKHLPALRQDWSAIVLPSYHWSTQIRYYDIITLHPFTWSSKLISVSSSFHSLHYVCLVDSLFLLRVIVTSYCPLGILWRCYLINSFFYFR